MSKTSSSRRVAFISGGGRGLGLETAAQLALLDIEVIIGVRSSEAGDAAQAAVQRRGAKVVPLVMDVTRPGDRQEVRDYLASIYGRLDILVNNAGIYLEGSPGHDRYQPSTLPEEVLRETFETNFFAAVALTLKLLPLLHCSQAGRIVNVSSILASLSLHSDPSSPVREVMASAYDTSKLALNSFTVHLAKELDRSRIKVNSAHPGWVQTDMGGSAAPMNVADGAKTSVLLATLPLDGPSGRFVHLGDDVPW